MANGKWKGKKGPILGKVPLLRNAASHRPKPQWDFPFPGKSFRAAENLTSILGSILGSIPGKRKKAPSVSHFPTSGPSTTCGTCGWVAGGHMSSNQPITDHHPLSTRWPPVGHPRPSPLPSSGGLGQQGVNRFSRWRRVRKHSSIHGHLSRIGRFSVLNYESISDDFYLSIFLFRFKIFLEISDAVDGNPLGKCSRDAQRN